MSWRDRLCSAEEATGVIRPGDHVFVGTGCAAPLALLRELEAMLYPPPGVELVHVLLSGALPEKYARGSSRFQIGRAHV